MVTSILSIVFLIIICVIFYDVATIRNCNSCKHRHNCWTKIDAQLYKHSCEHYEKENTLI